MDAAYTGTLSENRKARHDFEILEEYVAGMKLKGYEVKAVRTARVQLAGTYVAVSEKGTYLKQVLLPRYAPAREAAQVRDVELLIEAKEKKHVMEKLHEQGLSAVPLQIFCKGKYIKLRFALVKGRKKHDKRAAIKARDLDRESRREAA